MATNNKLSHIEAVVNSFNLTDGQRIRLVKAMDKDFDELRNLCIQDGTVFSQIVFYTALLELGVPENFVIRFSEKWDEVVQRLGEEKADSPTTWLIDLVKYLKSKGVDLEDDFAKSIFRWQSSVKD